MGLCEQGFHLSVGHADVFQVLLKAFNDHVSILRGILHTVGHPYRIRFPMVGNHLVVFAPNFVIFLLFAKLDLFDVGSRLREPLLLIAVLGSLKISDLHSLQSRGDTV